MDIVKRKVEARWRDSTGMEVDSKITLSIVEGSQFPYVLEDDQGEGVVNMSAPEADGVVRVMVEALAEAWGMTPYQYLAALFKDGDFPQPPSPDPPALPTGRLGVCLGGCTSSSSQRPERKMPTRAPAPTPCRSKSARPGSPP